MRLRVIPVVALAALALSLAACGGDGSDETGTAPAGATSEPGSATESEPAPSGEAAASEKVDIVEFTYQPDPVVIRQGGKVTWLNEDTAPHTATADDGSFDTGILERGKLKAETFKQVGTYPYFCTVHPNMRGTVEVVAKG